jgi:GH15 family glucan-1,4-alpha-glucosidase
MRSSETVIRLRLKTGLEGPIDHWRKIRDKIHQQVYESGLFERLLSFSNDVGLLSKEYDSRERHMLGNFLKH